MKKKALDTFYSHYGCYNYDHIEIDKEKLDLLNDCKTELISLLREWGITCYKSKTVISPYEIDIFCPDYNIGIEINGDLYHSFKEDNAPHCDGKDKFYHQQKSIRAESKGIFIFHIFEYELLDSRKKDVTISQLRNLFFKNNSKIYARNCEIVEITKTEKDLFLQQNHRQGRDLSSVYYGLKKRLFHYRRSV